MKMNKIGMCAIKLAVLALASLGMRALYAQVDVAQRLGEQSANVVALAYELAMQHKQNQSGQEVLAVLDRVVEQMESKQFKEPVGQYVELLKVNPDIVFDARAFMQARRAIHKGRQKSSDRLEQMIGQYGDTVGQMAAIMYRMHKGDISEAEKDLAFLENIFRQNAESLGSRNPGEPNTEFAQRFADALERARKRDMAQVAQQLMSGAQPVIEEGERVPGEEKSEGVPEGPVVPMAPPPAAAPAMPPVQAVEGAPVPVAPPLVSDQAVPQAAPVPPKKPKVDDRSALLEQIRQGVELKPASDRPATPPKELTGWEKALADIRSGIELKPASDRPEPAPRELTGWEKHLAAIREGVKLKSPAERKVEPQQEDDNQNK